MYKSILYFLFLFHLHWSIYCQRLISLHFFKSDTSLHNIGETEPKVGGSWSLSKVYFQINVKKPDDLLDIDTLDFYNNDYYSAYLYQSINKCLAKYKLETEPSFFSCFRLI